MFEAECALPRTFSGARKYLFVAFTRKSVVFANARKQPVCTCTCARACVCLCVGVYVHVCVCICMRTCVRVRVRVSNVSLSSFSAAHISEVCNRRHLNRSGCHARKNEKTGLHHNVENPDRRWPKRSCMAKSKSSSPAEARMDQPSLDEKGVEGGKCIDYR